jgi:Secretion system C-terminal sorting domain
VRVPRFWLLVARFDKPDLKTVLKPGNLLYLVTLKPVKPIRFFNFFTRLHTIMKKTLLLSLLLLSGFASLYAQIPQCKRDSSVLKDTANIVAPLPYTMLVPKYNLNEACINQPYRQFVTIEVPPTIVVAGIPATLTSASLATTGAVVNLPSGLTYACDPPNCVFNSGTLGCIVVYGTPNMPKPTLPDTFDLKINANVLTTLLPVPVPVEFPGPIAPGNYFMVVKPAGSTCLSSTIDLGSRIASMKNAPNPFGDQTLIEVESMITGDFNFEVFDLLGQRVHLQSVRLNEGANQLTFDAGELPNGSYLYSLNNGQGRATKMMVIAR